MEHNMRVPIGLSLENWSPKNLVLETKFFMENWSMDQKFHGKLALAWSKATTKFYQSIVTFPIFEKQ